MRNIFLLEEKTTYRRQIVNQDGLWKKVISNLFEDFLLFFVPDLHTQVDFTKKPDFLQQELFQEIMDDKKGHRIADQVVKVHLKDGKEQWIVVHVEVQGNYEEAFAKRMFEYFYRIYDHYGRKIVAIAVMTSPHQSKISQDFHYTYFGTELHYTYNSCKIADYDKQELERSEKVFSKIVLAAIYMHETKSDVDKRYAFKMKLMRDILRNNKHSTITLQATLHFIDYLLRLPDELTEQLTETIRPIIQKEGKHMIQYDKNNWSPTIAAVFELERKEGKEEGIQTGVMMERNNIARALLQENMPVASIEKITTLTRQEIEKLKQEIEVAD